MRPLLHYPALLLLPLLLLMLMLLARLLLSAPSACRRSWKRWKLSSIDLAARTKAVQYLRARDEMLERTDFPWAQWWVVPSDDKQASRLNCIQHLLCQIPYENVAPEPVQLPKREKSDYTSPPKARPGGASACCCLVSALSSFSSADFACLLLAPSVAGWCRAHRHSILAEPKRCVSALFVVVSAAQTSWNIVREFYHNQVLRPPVEDLIRAAAMETAHVTEAMVHDRMEEAEEDEYLGPE